MTKLVNLLILASGMAVLVFGALNSSLATEDNGNDLLELFKKPRLTDSFGVEPKAENYSSDDEARALSTPRELFARLNKYPIEGELDVKTNRNYALARSKYNSVSTGGIEGWNYDIPFSMPIVVWIDDKPSIDYVDRDNYLIELNRYSDSEIMGYIVKDEVAYVVLGLTGQSEFQILELVWSDHQLPYFSGYYFQISSDPIPETRAIVFDPVFLKELQAELFAE